MGYQEKIRYPYGEVLQTGIPALEYSDNVHGILKQPTSVYIQYKLDNFEGLSNEAKSQISILPDRMIIAGVELYLQDEAGGTVPYYNIGKYNILRQEQVQSIKHFLEQGFDIQVLNQEEYEKKLQALIAQFMLQVVGCIMDVPSRMVVGGEVQEYRGEYWLDQKEIRAVRSTGITGGTTRLGGNEDNWITVIGPSKYFGIKKDRIFITDNDISAARRLRQVWN